MVKIKFISTVWKSGHSHVITVPKPYIKHNIIKPEFDYEIILKEVKNGEEVETNTN